MRFCSLLFLIFFATTTESFSQIAANAKITKPVPGTEVFRGDTIDIVVETQGLFQSLCIIGVIFEPSQYCVSSGSSPYTFRATVGMDADLGEHFISSLMLSTQYPQSRAISGEAEVPLVVSTKDAFQSLQSFPPTLTFRALGETRSLSIGGKTLNGDVEIISLTPQTRFRSEHPGVARVGSTATVTAVGAGETAIVVEYQGSNIRVPVTVRAARRGDLDGDDDVDNADINVLLGWLNRPAAIPSDAKDFNGDGKIDALDTRILTTLCTRPRCAIQ